VDILLVVINGYCISGYWWIFSWWLLMVIVYWWMFSWWLLMIIVLVAIGGYSLGDY